MLKKNQEIELEITDMTVDGDGIGKADGLTVFVIGGIIGDLLSVGITKVKKRYCFARIIRILRPSPHRVDTRPGEHAVCGGCRLQQVVYPAQLEMKERQILNNFRRIGGFQDIPADPILGMKNPTHYRNKAQYPLTRLKDGKIAYGFYAPHSHRVIPNPTCLIQSEATDRAMAAVCRFLNDFDISVYDETTGRGLMRHVMIREGRATGELMVCPVINGSKLPHSDEFVRRLKDTFSDPDGPQVVSVVLNINRDNTNVVLGKEIRVLYGRDFIRDSIGSRMYRISPLAFFQVNPEQTEVLYDTVVEFAELKPTDRVWDLYCGAGTIGLYLADRAREIIGIEIVPEAIEDARKNAEENCIGNARFYCGDAKTVFHNLLADGIDADVIIVDPPRKGCDRDLLEDILKVNPDRIVYVSCDSATQARDAAILCENGYRPVRMQPVDMFPMTTHCENVLLLKRR